MRPHGAARARAPGPRRGSLWTRTVRLGVRVLAGVDSESDSGADSERGRCTGQWADRDPLNAGLQAAASGPASVSPGHGGPAEAAASEG